MQLHSQPPVLGSSAPLAAPDDGSAPPAIMPAFVETAGWSPDQWRQAATGAYDASKTWFDASVRSTIQQNYAHFQSRHAPGSKYYHEVYRLRSQLFRPKTRSMVRRTEAAVAVALFSTQDLLAADAWNNDDPDQHDAAEVAKALLQYRLERTLPWFQTVVGAAQEAAVHGRPVARLGWRYRTRKSVDLSFDADGKPIETPVTEVVEDKPYIDLIAPENIRLDPGCDWRDPVNTSPYFIENIPMFVGDAKQMIEEANAQYGGELYVTGLTDSNWWTFAKRDYDSIRQARNSSQVDNFDLRRGAVENEMIWIQRVFMRRNGEDYTFDMVSRDQMLSIPRLVREVYPHLDEGQRPYIMGTSAIEAHKAYPTSPVGMVKDTQIEVNELANLRVDGIRLAILNRWLVRRGATLDQETLKYGAANSIIQTENINQDVRELRAQDIGQSAFAEGDRLNADFDEIGGNFSLASVANNRRMNDTVGGMNLLSGDASQVKEYEIRTFVETFVEPVINMLYALEQTYETDEKLLTDVCTRTQIPIDRVVQLLSLKIRIRVAVGFNSTSPQQRIQRLQAGIKTVAELAPEAVATLNAGEIIKEVFGALGYEDGERFFGGAKGQDPQVAALQQEVQQLKAQLQGKQADGQTRIAVAQIAAKARLQQAAMDGATRRDVALIAARVQAQSLRLSEIDAQMAMEEADNRKIELAMEREALSHSIQQDRTNMLLKIADGLHGTNLSGKGKGPPVVAGADKSGVIARDHYGQIPFEAG